MPAGPGCHTDGCGLQAARGAKVLPLALKSVKMVGRERWVGRYQTLSEPRSVLGVTHWVKAQAPEAPALFLWAEKAGGDVDLGMSSLPTPMCQDRWGLGLPSLQVNTPA